MRKGTPAEDTSGIIVDWLQSVEMGRRDRNALIRTLHVARERAGERGAADPAPADIPELAAPAEPVPAKDLTEVSAWDHSDDDTDAAVAECVSAAQGLTTALAEADILGDRHTPAEADTRTDESATSADHHDPEGRSDLNDDNDVDDYTPRTLEIR